MSQDIALFVAYQKFTFNQWFLFFSGNSNHNPSPLPYKPASLKFPGGWSWFYVLY